MTYARLPVKPGMTVEEIAGQVGDDGVRRFHIRSGMTVEEIPGQVGDDGVRRSPVKPGMTSYSTGSK